MEKKEESTDQKPYAEYGLGKAFVSSLRRGLEAGIMRLYIPDEKDQEGRSKEVTLEEYLDFRVRQGGETRILETPCQLPGGVVVEVITVFDCIGFSTQSVSARYVTICFSDADSPVWDFYETEERAETISEAKEQHERLVHIVKSFQESK